MSFFQTYKFKIPKPTTLKKKILDTILKKLSVTFLL